MFSHNELRDIMPDADAARWHGPLVAACTEFGIDTAARQAMFLAQIAHESGELTQVAENLNYSENALRRLFFRHFRSDHELHIYARRPEKIANRVYANRMGNGDEASGDGWRYRGRGPIQITGAGNYRRCGLALGLDLLSDPDQLLIPQQGARAAAWFFRARAAGNTYADRGDLAGCTRRINGGLNGLEERRMYWIRAARILEPR